MIHVTQNVYTSMITNNIKQTGTHIKTYTIIYENVYIQWHQRQTKKIYFCVSYCVCIIMYQNLCRNLDIDVSGYTQVKIVSLFVIIWPINRRFRFIDMKSTQDCTQNLAYKVIIRTRILMSISMSNRFWSLYERVSVFKFMLMQIYINI